MTIEVDDPLVMDSKYRFGPVDRRKIDDQVREIQQHLVDNPPGASSDTADNLGGHAEIFKEKSAGEFKFRTVEAGTNVTITQTANSVKIDASGGGAAATVADDIGKSGPTDIDRVNGFKGRPLSDTAPTVGQKYVWNGTEHVPAGRAFHVSLFADAGATPDADHFGSGYDWADAIEAAIEALDDVNGGRVEFDPTPYGAGYRISRTINVTRSTKLVGHGAELFFSGTEIVADAGITAFRVWGAGFAGAPNGAPDTIIEGISVTSLDPSVTLIAPGTTTTGNYVYADTDMTVTDCEDFVNGQNISLEGVGPMNTLAHTLAATTTGSPTVTLSSSGDQVPVVRAGMYIIVGSAFPTPTKVLVRTDLVLTMASNAVTDLVGSPVQYCSPVYARIVSGAASAPGALDGTTSWVIDTTLPIISLNPCEIRHANVAFDLTNIVRFNGVSASHFNGPAFLCRGAAGDTPAKSFNVSSMMNLRSQSCRNAIAIMGADANAGTFQVSALGCFDWNIADFSHLGNTYIGVHTDGGNGIITHDASGNACVFLGCYTEGGTFNSYGPGALILGQAQAIFGGGMSIVKGGIANHWQVGSSSITRHAIVFEPSGNFFRVQSSTGSGSFKLAADTDEQFGTPGYIRWSFDGAFRNQPLVFADSDQTDMKVGSMWLPSGFLLGEGASKNLDASQAARIASCHSDATDGGVVVDPTDGPYDAFSTAVGTNLPRWSKGDWVRDPELLDGCPTRHVIEGGHRAPGWVASTSSASYSTICPSVDNHSGSYFTNVGAPGTTGAVEPDWSTAPALGDTIADNDVTWTNAGDAAYTQPVELDGYIVYESTTSETWAQSKREFLCGSIAVLDTDVSLAAALTLTLPKGRYKRWFWNKTAQDLKIKTTVGKAVTIAPGMAAEVGCDGIRMLRRTPDVIPLAAFSPMDQIPTEYWSAPYAPSVWLGANGKTLIVNADGDAVAIAGTPVDGVATAKFVSGTGHALESTDAATNYVGTAAGTILILAKFTSPAATGGVFSDPAICVDSSGSNLAISYSTSGIGGGVYCGTQKIAVVACAPGDFHLITLRWDSANVDLDIDDGAVSDSDTMTGPISSLSAKLMLGKMPGIAFADVEILEFETFDRRIDNDERAEFFAYCQATYPSLGL